MNGSKPSLSWHKLPPLPDKEGFAGLFVGVSDGRLITAGGANFPKALAWEGGKKAWYDSIYVLDSSSGKWCVANQKLPRPLAYGVSATWKDTLICVGGSDGEHHYDHVFSLRLIKDSIQIDQLPSLPQPCAEMCGALIGSQLYIAGGTRCPGDTTAMHTFWRLDLDHPPNKRCWEELTPWPGPERSHAIAATLGNSFFLISGVRWQANAQGGASRITPFLSDAYCYSSTDKSTGNWRRISDVPRPVAAAPSPAMVLSESAFAILGGIDHAVASLDAQSHPGFLLDTFIYDSDADQWALGSEMPIGASRVTASSAQWNDWYVVANGERSPSRRSPDVYAYCCRPM